MENVHMSKSNKSVSTISQITNVGNSVKPREN